MATQEEVDDFKRHLENLSIEDIEELLDSNAITVEWKKYGPIGTRS